MIAYLIGVNSGQAFPVGAADNLPKLTVQNGQVMANGAAISKRNPAQHGAEGDLAAIAAAMATAMSANDYVNVSVADVLGGGGGGGDGGGGTT